MLPRLKKTYLDHGAIFYDNKEFNEILRYLDTDIELANLLSSEILEDASEYYSFLIHLDVSNCINIIRHNTLQNHMEINKYKYIVLLCFVFILCDNDSVDILSNNLDILEKIYSMITHRDGWYVLNSIIHILVSYLHSDTSNTYNNNTSRYDAMYPDGIPEHLLQDEFDKLMEESLKTFISVIKILKVINIYGLHTTPVNIVQARQTAMNGVFQMNDIEHTVNYIFNIFIETLTNAGVEFDNNEYIGPIESEEYLKDMLVIYYESETMKSANSVDEMLSDITRNHIYNR